MTGPADALDALTAPLYEVRPEAFVEARTALVKQLRAEKRRDDAKAVAALRRPSVSAWALNQVARHEAALVDAALDTGLALGQAMTAALTGDASGLKDAQRSHRDAVAEVARAAIAHIGENGDGYRGRIEDTVRAAVLDAEPAAAWKAGRLDRDLDNPGLGLDPSAVPALLAVRKAPPTKAALAPRTRTKGEVAEPEPAPEEPAEPEEPAHDAALEARLKAAEEAIAAKARADLEARIERLRNRIGSLEDAAQVAESLARKARAAVDDAKAELRELEDEAKR